MGASMVSYGDKIWVQGGADPYGTGEVFNDFFSFGITSGLWKKESGFAELKDAEGVLLGQACRMYNSDAVVFSGGCNIRTTDCIFDTTKSILFDQPTAHPSPTSQEGLPGRMGHSLIQVGESVISFGGCSFGKHCYNDLLIQKPKITEASSRYDCKNGGQIVEMGFQGQSMQMCKCLDLYDKTQSQLYTGPQCTQGLKLYSQPQN